MTMDYTPILKRKIEELIQDIKHLPEADHAVRELMILNSRLTDRYVEQEVLDILDENKTP